MKEQECAWQHKQGLNDISACREDLPVEDFTPKYRTHKLPDAAQVPLQNDDIWEQRFKIITETDEEKIRLLQEEIGKQSDERLEKFYKSFNRAVISAKGREVQDVLLEEMNKRTKMV